MSKKITIVGCGLIGGSIALALKALRGEWEVVCLDRSERIPALRDAGVAEETGTFDDVGRYVPESALVVLATPIHVILDQLERLSAHLQPGTIVTDVGSTKARIMEAAGRLMPPGTHFVGGHPMAGSARSGVEAADPLLFSERIYMLCPHPDTPPEVMVRMIDFVQGLQAWPFTIDPQEHDRITAMTSHVPQLIAVALMHAALGADAAHGLLDLTAGRAFMDMTRIAASDLGVWRGVLETNTEAIGESLARFERSLSLLREAVRAGDAALVWERASSARRRMGLDTLPRPRKTDLRGLIDRQDRQILTALGQRMRLVRKIGKLKAGQASPVVDPERERLLIGQRVEWARALGLPADLIDELFSVILRHSARIQTSEN